MGLSAGGLIRRPKVMASETTTMSDTIKQNEKNEEIVSYLSFPHQRKVVPEIVALWLKNGNQRVLVSGLML